MRKIVTALFIVVIALAAICGCSRFGKSTAPSTEFAPYIKAYTSSIISESSTIKIELGSKPELDIEDWENLFSFTPPIKGSCKWTSENVVVFIPETAALKAGQTYKGSFHLDKIQHIADKKLKTFPFEFKVAGKEAEINIERVIIRSDAPDEAELVCNIKLSQSMDKEELSSALKCSEKCQIVIDEDENNGRFFRFLVSGIKREEKSKTVSLSLGNSKFKLTNEAKTVIPSKEGFSVISCELIEESDSYIDIVFSQPISDKLDLSGFISLKNVNRHYFKVQDNHIRCFVSDIPSSSKKLSINISKKIRSSKAEELADDFFKEFVPKEIKPQVIIPLNGNILPDKAKLVLPFKAVNLKAVDLSIIKIYSNNVLTFLQTNNLDDNDELRRSGRLVYKGRLRLDSDPSKNLHNWQDFSVDLSNLFKKEPGAIYRIRLTYNINYSIYKKDNEDNFEQMREISSTALTAEDLQKWDEPNPYYWESFYDWSTYNWHESEDPLKPSYYMDSSRFPEINLMTSNIGLSVKYAGTDELFVAASDILSAKPLFGVDFDVVDYQLQKIGTGRSDSKGLDIIKLSGKPFAIVASRNGATTYLKLTDGEEKSLSRFDVGGRKLEKGLKAFIYGERGVWRPGDTLHLTMILHSKEGKLPEKHPVSLEIYNAQGQFYNKIINSNSTDGFYTFAVPTKQDDPTGIWNAYFKIGGASFHKSLRIESIKANRLRIRAGFSDEVIKSDTRSVFDISSSWLTGPPASGLKAKVMMNLQPGTGSFKGFKGYVFEDPAARMDGVDINLINVDLDANGKAQVNAAIPKVDGAGGMLKANIVTSVEEQGGDASFVTSVIPFSPFSSYAGVRVPEGELETDVDHKIDIVVVDPEGKAVSGHNIAYKIYKLKWSWWWESKASEMDSYLNGTQAEVITSGNLVSGREPLSVNFGIKYPDWGRFLIYVQDLDSGHSTGQSFVIDWPAYRGRSQKSDPDALTMITFATDKDSYEVGEEATVYLPAADGGQVLVSLENAGTVLQREWVRTAADKEIPYRFKIKEEMGPNFYIHLSLVQPHGNTANDLPLRLYGVKPVTVENPQTLLEPVIKMADSVQPEEEFTINVSEKNGKTMTYTIAVVDEGLLDITSFKTPDPLSEFNAKEALGVKTWDIYDNVIGAYSGRFSPMFSVGGDENLLLGTKKDNRFNPVVKFLGPFTLKSGSAKHKVKLPMYIGSVRVMLVASHNGAGGFAQKAVPVKSKLMILPSAPRITGTNEKIILPVNVFAMEDGVKDVKLKVSVSGAMSIEGGSEKTVSFENASDKIVRFNLLTGDEEGPAEITVTASSGELKTSAKTSLSVRNPMPIVAKEVSRIIPGGGSETFSQLGKNAVLELSSFPAINFDKAFIWIKGCEYYSTEQLVSEGIGLVNIQGLISEVYKEEAKELIQKTLQEVYSRQLASGGFAYWPGSAIADEWVSSMAGQFLIQAGAAGFDVSKGVINNWKRFQQKCVQDYRATDKNANTLYQAYRLFTLALATSPDNAAMNRMKESRNYSVQAALMLSCAYSVCGKKAIADDILNSDIDEDRLEHGSWIRNLAMTLMACILSDDTDYAVELASEHAQSLSESHPAQDLAFVATAMNYLSEKVTAEPIDIVLISEDGKEENLRSAKTTVRENINGQSIILKNQSAGDICASISMLERASGEYEAKGLKLSVSYVLQDGSAINPVNLKQGTDFTAIIKVESSSLLRDYSNLALAFSLPSGWEISAGDSSVAAAQNSFDYNDVRDDKCTWYFSLDRGSSKTFKLKLRAAYEGSFTLPSCICESTEDVSIRAASASQTVKVSR